MFNTNFTEGKVAATETVGYGKVLENIMVVGLLSGAATMGQYLATTLSSNMNNLYQPPIIPQGQFQPQKLPSSNNPFTQPQQPTSSNLQKYRGNVSNDKWNYR